jgi:hypothetical protein
LPRKTDSDNPADWLWIAERDLVALEAMAAQEFGEEIRPLVAALAEAYFTARYPGFDFDDPDWAALRVQVAAVAALFKLAQARLGTEPA